MTVSSVKTGELSLSFALNNNYMEPIATTLVGSGGVNQITFNDIPQTYKHLQIRATYKDINNAGYAFSIRFNADSANNYANHFIRGNGATASASGTANRSFIEIGNTWGSAGGAFTAAVIDILDYTSISKNKTIRSLNGVDLNGSGNVHFSSGLYMSLTSIESIFMFNDVNFAQHSRFSLYGIKG